MRPADLRAFAREWDGGCLVRVPGVCRYGPTCLAHLRIANVAGVGQKPPDLCGVIACDSCHKVIDRQTHLNHYSREEVRTFVLEALVRTLALYARWFDLVARDP